MNTAFAHESRSPQWCWQFSSPELTLCLLQNFLTQDIIPLKSENSDAAIMWMLIRYEIMKHANAAKTLLEKWPEKIQALNGIRVRDLCVTDAMLYQLSYQRHMRAVVRPFMFGGRNTRQKYMNSMVIDVQQWQFNNEIMKDANAAMTLMEKWPEKIQALNGIRTHNLTM